MCVYGSVYACVCACMCVHAFVCILCVHACECICVHIHVGSVAVRKGEVFFNWRIGRSLKKQLMY